MRDYDEFERAYTGRSRKGLHPLAWLGIAIGSVVLLAMAVVGIGTMIFVNRVQDFAEGFQANPARSAAEMLARFDPELDLVDFDDEAGTVTLHNLRDDRTATFDFEDIVEGRLYRDQADGDFELDLDGSLDIRTEEGRVTIDLEGDEEGGTLVIETDDGTARIGAGRGAESLPRWVPIYEDASAPRRIYSASADEGVLGAVTWETERSPERVVDFYAEWLEDEGYTVRTERFSDDCCERQGAVWGTLDDDERTVFVLVVQDDGRTRVFLNYGEKS